MNPTLRARCEIGCKSGRGIAFKTNASGSKQSMRLSVHKASLIKLFTNRETLTCSIHKPVWDGRLLEIYINVMGRSNSKYANDWALRQRVKILLNEE